MKPDSVDDLEKIEVVDDLLDEIWFFDNLLDPRTRVLRYSKHPKMANLAAAKKSSEEDSSSRRNLVRAPSLPSYIERKETERKGINSKRISKLTRQLSEKISIQEPKSPCLPKKELVQGKAKDGVQERSTLTGQSSKGGLQRTQTLPSCIGREDTDVIQDQESDTRLSFLIREALASSSSKITPPRQASKVQFSSTPRQRPPRNSEAESTDTNFVKEMRRTLQKTLSNLETAEIQGFKDLGFEFQKQDLNIRLREKNRQDKGKRPYLSEALLARSHAPPIPTCVAKDLSGDMKAQIKFWARAVASNVRQEC